MVGLLPGVPGLSLGPSLFFREGVDLDEEDMFDGGRLAFPPPAEDGPFSTRCSPLTGPELFLGTESSSPPTSTTRSPSLFSPPSDS